MRVDAAHGGAGASGGGGGGSTGTGRATTEGSSISCSGAVAGATIVVDGPTVEGGSVLIPTVDDGRAGALVGVGAVGVTIMVAIGTGMVETVEICVTAVVWDDDAKTSAATSEPATRTTAPAVSQVEGAPRADRHDHFGAGS